MDGNAVLAVELKGGRPEDGCPKDRCPVGGYPKGR